MQYHKFKIGDTVIEFHNSWLGEETVIVNGKTVSKQSSFRGRHHHFSIMEDGSLARYVLTSKITQSMQVALDLRRNGTVLQEDVIIRAGGKPKMPSNTYKEMGLALLNEYDLEAAIIQFKKALDLQPEDPEIYFHLACAYSVQELALMGFEAIKKSVELKLPHTEMIYNHEMLAFLRIHPAFDAFHDSGFSEINADLFN